MLRSLSRALMAQALLSSLCLADPLWKPRAIVSEKPGTFAQALAPREVRRYVYVRTGQLLPWVDQVSSAPSGDLLVMGTKTQGIVRAVAGQDLQASIEALKPEEYLLRTQRGEDRAVLLVVGGDDAGLLYGAYRLAEILGVRFYLHGDVIPEVRIPCALPDLDERGHPLFDRRGIQPFHDFPEGPDWWSTEDYKAILSQLPKLRMNFFGLHTYPEGGVGPEPVTWIGQPKDVEEDGRVKASYPSRHFTTSNLTGAWGYRPMKTSDYVFGAADLFDRDDFGSDIMRDTFPWNQMSESAQNALFDRMGACLRDSFSLARRLGIKTCIGTETPLILPAALRERLKSEGKDPSDPAVIADTYEGLFLRIMRTHPLDVYWLWTPEGWTWSGVKQEDIDATVKDLKIALAVLDRLGQPFTLATCGWVLGPEQDRALFDRILPKASPMSCINRQVGHSPVEPGFAQVQGRPTWAIPWLEDDPALLSPQLWAGRMRKDAADALAYGCSGLMGIHWRTRILAPNVSALAHAAWDQSQWNPRLSGQPLPEPPKPPEGPDGGQFASFSQTDFADTDEDPVYQTVRYNVKAYHLDLPNGSYQVSLQLCEPHYREPNRRVFGIKVQDRILVERIDLFAEVGPNRAKDVGLQDVQVAKGRLTIEFMPIVEFPCIAGIVVQGENATRKINCGGPAWQDYQADWPPRAPSVADRFLPCQDFYEDWALYEFGPEVGLPAGQIFARIDGKLPRPSDWVDGPGGIRPDPRPWSEVAKEYAFVDELAGLHAMVRGSGNLERFNYWQHQMEAMKANAQVNCTWAQYNEVLARVKAEPDADKRRTMARDLALPVRKDLVAQVAVVHQHLLSSATTLGDMGTVTNWQQHILPALLTHPGEELAGLLGEALPQEAQPSQAYLGPFRVFVPTLRSSLTQGESLCIRAIVLGPPPRKVTLHYRPLGHGPFRKVPLRHVARGVYEGILDPTDCREDLECYVRARAKGQSQFYPAGAPDRPHTVLVVPAFKD